MSKRMAMVALCISLVISGLMMQKLEATDNGFTISTPDGQEGGYTYQNGVLRIYKSGTYHVSMKQEGGENQTDLVTSHRIEISADGSQKNPFTLTLDNVHIDVSKSRGTPALLVNTRAEVIILLQGENSLKSPSYQAGLEKRSGFEMIIDTKDGEKGSLVATGGDYAAGIGSGYKSYIGASCENIKIGGGNILAVGSPGASDIGNGQGTEKTTSLQNGLGQEVYPIILDLSLFGQNQTIQTSEIRLFDTEEVYAYNLNEVGTDEEGKLRLYLPAGEYRAKFGADKLYHYAFKVEAGAQAKIVKPLAMIETEPVAATQLTYNGQNQILIANSPVVEGGMLKYKVVEAREHSSEGESSASLSG